MGKIAEKITLRSQRGYIGNRRVLFPRVRSVTQRIMEAFEHGRNGHLHNFAASYLNQLSIGTTPVTAVTDPVGLVMDTRLGMALGSELVDTINTSAMWTVYGTNTVAQDGDAVKITYVDNAAGAFAYFSAAGGLSSNLTVNKFYLITYEVKVNSGSCNALVVNASANSGDAITSTSYITQQFIFQASDVSLNYFRFLNLSAGEIVWIKNISVRLFEGNHAIQATAGNRPTWTNRVNLLTNTMFAGAVAGTPGTAPTSWPFQVAGGVTEAIPTSGITYSATTGNRHFVGQSVVLPINGVLTYSANIDAVSGDANSAVISVVATVGGITGTTAILASNGTGRKSLTITAGAAGATVLIKLGVGTTGNLASNASVTISEPQLEYGTTATRYQRVTTATDFDTAGFPYYLSFPGASVSLTSATGGGGSAGFFWCGVVQPTGGAGTGRCIWSDETGFNGYQIRLTAANIIQFSAGNGAAFTTRVSTATLSVGTKYLITCWDDGVNLNVQINAAAAETVARPVVTAGTTSFTLCKDNGAASSFLIANFYPDVYWKDTAGTAAERADAQAYCRMMGGL